MSKLLPSFGVLRPKYALDVSAHRGFAQRAEVVAALERCNYTCEFCGFVDRKYLEIHNKDGNHKNFDQSNLMGACTLCHAHFHLLSVASRKAAVLGYMSEPDVIALNHVQRFTLVLGQHPNKEISKHFVGRDSKINAGFVMMASKLTSPKQLTQYGEQTKLISETAFTEYSVVELGLALGTCSQEAYDRFKQGKLVLLFNARIFTPEQIQYYQTLPDFDFSKWAGILTADSNENTRSAVKG